MAKLKTFLRDRGCVYGLSALGCFGSVAQQQATCKSDVDVVYQTDPSARLTLFDVVLLREELVTLLDKPVDLIEFREGMPLSLKERVKREAVYV
jgi:predicted nucleotidyltransferase